MLFRKYFEFTGCALYAIILLPVLLTKDKSFRSSFWIFFISAGIYGIYCVLIYTTKLSWNVPTSVIQRATSTISALGHTIAKFYVVLNRYIVLRSNAIKDNDWSRSWIIGMLVVQFLVPLLAASPFAFVQPTEIGDYYGPPYLINIVQSISAIIYGSYVIVGSVMTFLSMRKLRRLLNVANDGRKLSAARQEVMITIYSTALFFSHLLKCIQQIVFVVYEGDPAVSSVAFMLYPYINDFAVFSSPLLMLTTSSKLRRLIISYFRPSTWSQTAPSSLSITQF